MRTSRGWAMLIGATLGLAFSLPGYAGWAVLGAASECDSQARKFSLAATVEVGEGNSGEVPIEEGFSALREGQNEIFCRVGAILVWGTIAVHPASGRRCM